MIISNPLRDALHNRNGCIFVTHLLLKTKWCFQHFLFLFLVLKSLSTFQSLHYKYSICKVTLANFFDIFITLALFFLCLIFCCLSYFSSYLCDFGWFNPCYFLHSFNEKYIFYHITFFHPLYWNDCKCSYQTEECRIQNINLDCH